MNLLPKSHEEFAQTEYWNTFFKRRGEKSFEWYVITCKEGRADPKLYMYVV